MPISAELLLDTSAAIALFQQGHVGHHAVVRRTAGRRLGLAGHAAAELVSVLTRMPPPHRVPGYVACDYLAREFEATVEGPPIVAALRECARAGVVGGAVYDGLVGLAARHAGVVLISRDERAIPTYRALGVPFEVISE